MDAETLEQDITEGAEGTEGTQQVEKKEPAVDPNAELRASMQTLASTVTKLAAPKEEVKQRTPEELAEDWGVWNPEKSDPEFFRKFMRLNPEMDKAEATAAINEYKQLFGGMQKGMVKQAIVGALKVLRDNDLKALREEFEPVREHVSQTKAEKTRDRFYSAFPALVDTSEFKFSKAVNDTARDLADKEFADEPAYFKALAEGAAERVKGYNPSFDLGAAKPKQTAGTSPRLPRTSVGGTGGSGNGGGAATKKSGSDDDSDSIVW